MKLKQQSKARAVKVSGSKRDLLAEAKQVLQWGQAAAAGAATLTDGNRSSRPGRMCAQRRQD